MHLYIPRFRAVATGEPFKGTRGEFLYNLRFLSQKTLQKVVTKVVTVKAENAFRVSAQSRGLRKSLEADFSSVFGSNSGSMMKYTSTSLNSASSHSEVKASN